MAYHEPLALVIIPSISIGLGAIAALFILIDIIIRRGWKSMMLVMIPVYIINALYLWPITLWTYLNYGRPAKLARGAPSSSHFAHHSPPSEKHNTSSELSEEAPQKCSSSAGHGKFNDEHTPSSTAQEGKHCHNKSKESEMESNHQHGHNHETHCGGDRPMFATITVAVCHCGAGCVLGDIIGEWLVYGTGATINGQALWVDYLVDFAFAIAIGIVFQYYSIAPMSGDYGIKTLWRAAKADFLSLLFFEIGLFAWMAIFQIAIFKWELPMTTVTYWWMMQIGMFLGHWTGMPINWYLIKTGVKEPCA